MCEVTHTPGPWTVELSPVRKALCVMADCTWICGELQAANSTAIPDEECEANARLIAGAPEMLAALKAIIIRCEDGDKCSDWLPVIANIARAAIAKADDGS